MSHVLTSEKWPQNFIRMLTSEMHIFIFSHIFFLSVPRQLLSEMPDLFTSAFFLTVGTVVATLFP